ncbi:MAG TPA: histidine kinase dimerization/phospho-acceptor domain-containing protein, partial [Polyangia bacterium]
MHQVEDKDPGPIAQGKDARISERDRRTPQPVGVTLVLSFAAVVASFVGATCYGELRARQIERAALTIEADAAPSIRRLANARTELRRVQLLVHRALEEGAAFRRVPEVESGRALLHNELSEYQDLPMQGQEQQVWSSIQTALARLDGDIGQVLHALRRGDNRAARAAAEDLDESSELVAERLLEAIDANVAEARRKASFIDTSRRRGTMWAALLDGAGVVLAGVAAGLVFRVVRAHTRLALAYREVAERRADELEAFATRMAHDVRTPLAGASLSLDVIERHAPSDERAQRAVKRARGALKQMGRIIEGLLEFARAGARPEKGATACIADIAEELAVAMRPRADQIEATLEVRAGSHAAVTCAEGMVASALGNLVANALTYV